MVLAISDSDVLIHFAKLNQLLLLKDQFSKIFISEIIYDETVYQGITLNKQDAFILKKFIDTEKLIFVEKVNNKEIIELSKKYHIHKGECSILALAKKYTIDYCLTNEIKVRNIMRSEGFKVIGTLGIILRSYNLQKMNKSNCLELLKIIQINSKEYRFHPKLISKIIGEVDKKKVNNFIFFLK